MRPEFPDVTVSKIRFLESEGLIEPARAPSGYRKFSLRDVERLRYVLGTQRDHYLPLRVIREHLDAIDRGARPPALPARSRPTSTSRQQERLPEGSTAETITLEQALELLAAKAATAKTPARGRAKAGAKPAASTKTSRTTAARSSRAPATPRASKPPATTKTGRLRASAVRVVRAADS